MDPARHRVFVQVPELLGKGQFLCKAAAERAFFRCLKELRQMARQSRAQAPAADAGPDRAMMGSFLEAWEAGRRMDAEFDAMYADLDIPKDRRPAHSPHLPPIGGGVDVPIAIGRRR